MATPGGTACLTQTDLFYEAHGTLGQHTGSSGRQNLIRVEMSKTLPDLSPPCSYKIWKKTKKKEADLNRLLIYFNYKLSLGSSWSRTTGFSRPSARWQGAPIPRWPRRAWGQWAWILTETVSSCSTCWRSTVTTPWWCPSSFAVAERRRGVELFRVLHYWLSWTISAHRCFCGIISFSCIFTVCFIWSLWLRYFTMRWDARRVLLDAAFGFSWTGAAAFQL